MNAVQYVCERVFVVSSGTFYISSNGSMATMWLSKVLSASPRIKCHHSLVDGRGWKDGALDALRHEERAFAGVVHLSASHGVRRLEDVHRFGAVFVALLRDPISVTSSQFIEKSKAPENALKWHRIANLTWLKEQDAPFAHVSAMALKHYFECACLHDDRMFLFEDYTTKYPEIQRLTQAITQGQIAHDPDIEQAFMTTGPVNHHHKAPVSWEEIYYKRWTPDERAVFGRIYQQLYSSIQEPEIKRPRRYTFLHELCAA